MRTTSPGANVYTSFLPASYAAGLTPLRVKMRLYSKWICVGCHQSPDVLRSSQISAVPRFGEALRMRQFQSSPLVVHAPLFRLNSNTLVRTDSPRLIGGSSRRVAGKRLKSGCAGSRTTSKRNICAGGASNLPVGPRPFTCSRRLTRNGCVPIGYCEKSIKMSARSAPPRCALFKLSGAGNRLPSLAM